MPLEKFHKKTRGFGKRRKLSNHEGEFIGRASPPSPSSCVSAHISKSRCSTRCQDPPSWTKMGQTVHEGNDHIQSIQSICRKTLEIDLFVYSALLKLTYPNPNPCKHFRVDDLRTKVYRICDRFLDGKSLMEIN